MRCAECTVELIRRGTQAWKIWLVEHPSESLSDPLPALASVTEVVDTFTLPRGLTELEQSVSQAQLTDLTGSLARLR